ncbi:MAG TPA: hypothetical protein VN729_11680, partial [Ktedonobacteraceae bacterium]|nr:hypothetical protein [Ktedonobacteraceae bacterium]
MRVAEKQCTEEDGIVAVSVDEKTLARLIERSKSRGRLPSRLIERRCGYEPVLSREASQPTPFLSLSWEHWLEVREQILRNLELFASAALEQRVDKVLSVGMEMQ